MCKKIRGTFYCEELFLVKHKTKLSCESAIFYNLTRDVILENCKFNYLYNTTVLPSILDGGSHILLANMLNPKRLICSYDQGLAKPLPTSFLCTSVKRHFLLLSFTNRPNIYPEKHSPHVISLQPLL